MQKTVPNISIVLPCQNEEKGLGFCLAEIEKTVREHGLRAEVIVSDSSSDQSPQIAKNHGAILVKHDKKGYGRAYLEGLKAARGNYIIMADADNTYDFTKIPDFIGQLDRGFDLVIGNRLGGPMEADAMPWANRHIGTPVLSLLLKIAFGATIKDSQSGMRAIKKESLEKLKLKTQGMEFASEMIAKALIHKLKITEIPIPYRKRVGQSKLRPIQDALRHMWFMTGYFFFSA